MKPTDKAPAINRLLDSILPGDRTRVGSIKANTCATCGDKADDFKDQVSEREFAISGMCQGCQDKVFSVGDEDEDDPIQ